MKVLKTLIYKGKMYEIGSDIEIEEKEILENCIKKGLVGEEIYENTVEETSKKTSKKK